MAIRGDAQATKRADSITDSALSDQFASGIIALRPECVRMRDVQPSSASSNKRWIIIAVIVAGIGLAAYVTAMFYPYASSHPFEGLADSAGRYSWPSGADVTLEHDSPVIRTVAARVLRQSPSDATTDQLRAFLHHEKPVTIAAALEVAGDLALTELLSDVVAHTSNPDANVRATAIWALGGLGVDAIPALLDLADDEALQPTVMLAFERMGAAAIDPITSRRAETIASEFPDAAAQIDSALAAAEQGKDTIWANTCNGLAMSLRGWPERMQPGQHRVMDVEVVNISGNSIVTGWLIFAAVELRSAAGYEIQPVVRSGVPLLARNQSSVVRPQFNVRTLPPGGRRTAQQISVELVIQEGVEQRGADAILTIDKVWHDEWFARSWRVERLPYAVSFTADDGSFSGLLSKGEFPMAPTRWVGSFEFNSPLIEMSERK